MTVTTGSHPGTPVKTCGPLRIKLPRFLRRQRKSPTSLDAPVSTDPANTPEQPVVLSFQETLNQRHFSKAAQNLISQENSLFGQGAKPSPEDRAKLESDYNALLDQIWLVIKATFSAATGEAEILKEAASAIQLEERQDRRWRDGGEGETPAWRPRGCRSRHDSLLQELVRTRMEDIEDVGGADGLSSSLKRETFRKGMRLKSDLLSVARSVKLCYPEEFDICNLYARLYHQAFAEQLRSITDFGLDVEDSIYVLCWVNDYYPNDVLKHSELKPDIDIEALGCLLPEELITPLTDQYLTYKESKMEHWGRSVLETQEKQMTNHPNKIDGCYSTELAIDYLQLFDTAVKESAIVLNDPNKVKRIAGQLKVFLTSYKMFLQETLREKQGQAAPTVKAHLASLKEFKRYIESNGDLFTTDTRESSLSIVAGLITASNSYLTSFAHKALKPKYSKLGTAEWFSGNYVDVLDEMEKHIKNLKTNLHADCHEALFGHMHREVLAEYVRRLLKRKLRLSDRAQQETAADLVCGDSGRLAELFAEAGSREDWLQNILLKIADVLRTQDPSFIQLEVAVLARDHPDLSSRHVGALLNLKHNLSSEDVSKIKRSVKETQQLLAPSGNHRPFFSMVPVRRQRLPLM